MKKVMCLVLALVLLCSLCACGKKEVEEPQKDNTATAEKQPVKATEKATEAATEAEEDLEEFHIPLAGINCLVPEEYGHLENGYVEVTTGRDEFIVSVCTGDEGSYSGNTAGVFDHLLIDYTIDVNKYLSPKANDQTWDLSYTEGATISGYEATKISGTVGHLGGSTYEVYGYSTIIEDCPVIFLGILRSKEQAQEDMDTMIALVEQMVSSIYK